MNVRIANDRRHMMRIIDRSETHQHVGTPVRLAVWQTAGEILLRVRKAVCIQTFSIKQSRPTQKCMQDCSDCLQRCDVVDSNERIF